MPTYNQVKQNDLAYAQKLGNKYPALTPLFDSLPSVTTAAELLNALVDRATDAEQKDALLRFFVEHALNGRAEKLAHSLESELATLVRVRMLRAARKFDEALKLLETPDLPALVAERAAVLQGLNNANCWQATIAALTSNPVDEVALNTLIQFESREEIAAQIRAALERAQKAGVAEAPIHAVHARFLYAGECRSEGAGQTTDVPLQEARDAVTSDPACVQARLALIDLLRDDSEIEKAIGDALLALPLHADIKRRFLHAARTTAKLEEATHVLADLKALDPGREEWLDIEISILTREGKVREAFRKAEAAEARKPTYQPLLQRIAYTYALTGRFDRADALLCAVPNRSEGTWTMWLMVLIMAGRYEDAIRVAEVAIKAIPGGARVLALKAWLHANNGETAKAHDMYDQAARREPTSYLPETSRCEVLLMQRRFDDAQHRAEKIVQLFPRALDVRLVLAEVALVKREYEIALKQIEEVLRRDRSRTDALQMKAIALYRSGKEITAFNELEKAIGLFPDSIGLIACRGYLRLLDSDMHRAEHDFEQARERKRTGVMSTTGLGIVYCHRREHRLAVAMFEQVCALHRGSPEAQVNLAWACYASNTPANRGRARRLALQALDSDCGSARAKSCLAEVSWAEGERRRAILEMAEAAEADAWKHDIDIQIGYGSMLARAGRIEEAKERLQAITIANPRNYAARVELASALMKSDDYAGAKAAARSAADEYPEFAPAHRLLAACIDRGGDCTKAEESLRIALSCCSYYELNEVRVELARLLLKPGGDAIRDDARVREAAQLLRRVVDSDPLSREAMLLQARAELKLGDPRRALSILDRVHTDERDETTLAVLRQLANEQLRDVSTKTQQNIVVSIVVLQLLFVWIRWYTDSMFANGTAFLTLVPVLTGLLIIGLVLPRLASFKMAAVEATLSSAPQTSRSEMPTLLPVDFRNRSPILPVIPVRAYDM